MVKMTSSSAMMVNISHCPDVEVTKASTLCSTGNIEDSSARIDGLSANMWDFLRKPMVMSANNSVMVNISAMTEKYLEMPVNRAMNMNGSSVSTVVREGCNSVMRESSFVRSDYKQDYWGSNLETMANILAS